MVRIQKGIFLHIPKTGGTFVTNYFRETGMLREEVKIEKFGRMIYLAHIDGTHITDQAQNDVVFCFVRHPLTWLRSYWQHRQFISDRSNGSIDTIVDFPFDDFVEYFIRDLPGYISLFFAGFADYSHFIGKQENLRDDLNHLLKCMRVNYNYHWLFDRPQENVNVSIEKFSMKQALKIMKLEQAMVQRFEYNYIPSGLIK